MARIYHSFLNQILAHYGVASQKGIVLTDQIRFGDDLKFMPQLICTNPDGQLIFCFLLTQRYTKGACWIDWKNLLNEHGRHLVTTKSLVRIKANSMNIVSSMVMVLFIVISLLPSVIHGFVSTFKHHVHSNANHLCKSIVSFFFRQ